MLVVSRLQLDCTCNKRRLRISECFETFTNVLKCTVCVIVLQSAARISTLLHHGLVVLGSQMSTSCKETIEPCKKSISENSWRRNPFEALQHRINNATVYSRGWRAKSTSTTDDASFQVCAALSWQNKRWHIFPPLLSNQPLFSVFLTNTGNWTPLTFLTQNCVFRLCGS